MGFVDLSFVSTQTAAVFGRLGRPVPATVTVLPTIVSNLPLGAGLTLSDVLVVDAMILTKYLNEGALEQHVILQPDGTYLAMPTTRFYPTPDEPGAHIDAYIIASPQVTSVTERVRRGVRPLFTTPDRAVVTTVTHQVEWRPHPHRTGTTGNSCDKSAGVPPFAVWPA